MKIIELKYSKTNTYLIKGEKGNLLFDTGWAGTFKEFCKTMHANRERVRKIDYILISHYHPDHMGIAQEIADEGCTIAACDVQKDFLHVSDQIFIKEGRKHYKPIVDKKVRFFSFEDSRSFLAEMGIDGEIIHTPGHSDDSITLILDSGDAFVGDLNPLYEYELHKGTVIEESWKKIFEYDPRTIYYGHAKTLQIENSEEDFLESEYVSGKKKVDIDGLDNRRTEPEKSKRGESLERSKKVPVKSYDDRKMVEDIVKFTKKGYSIDLICRKTGADRELVEDVMRMYLTHPGVSIQGVIDRIEIKGR